MSVAGAVVIWGSTGVAQAAVTNFSMTPASGTPGTVVHVSGTGCTPGLLALPATNFVTVTATTLGLAFRAPVTSNGSWQTTFSVPSGALGGAPAEVTAVCVSSSLPSLLTIYAPQQFTVTTVPGGTPTTLLPGLPALPTTIPSQPPQGGTTPPTHGTTPRTKPKGSDDPTVPPPTLGGGVSAILPGAPRGISDIGGGTTTSPASGTPKAPADPAVIALGKKHKGAEAATLQPADLALAADHSGGSGLGWLGWLLLVALLAAVIGAPAWLWWSRRNEAARPAEDVV